MIQPLKRALRNSIKSANLQLRTKLSFRALAADLARQVRTTNTTGKIQELRHQVQTGEYQVSPRELAHRMLLMETGE